MAFISCVMLSAALQRWLRAKPAKAGIALECDRMAGINRGLAAPHKELEKSRYIDNVKIENCQAIYIA